MKSRSGASGRGTRGSNGNSGLAGMNEVTNCRWKIFGCNVFPSVVNYKE